MDSAISPRRPYFVEGDDGLASLADMEVGFSGTQHQRQPFLSRSCYSSPFNGNTRNSFRSATVLSPRSGRFFDARLEEHRPHFLESCFYCKKPLGNNKDIFMYRGDTPFCSEDCRQEQIEIDEANENNQNLSSSMKALRKKEQRESASPNETQDYPFRTSTIAAA